MNRSRTQALREWDRDLSVTLAPHELQMLADPSESINDMTLMRSSFAPAKDATVRHQDLSVAFFEIAQSANIGGALETLARFEETCAEALDAVDPWQRFGTHNSWLAGEADTWRLLRALHTDRLCQNRSKIDFLSPDDALSPRKLIGAYFQSSSDVRLMQLVVDWLEVSAAYRDSAMPTATRPGGALHWENTLHHLLNGESLFNSHRVSNLITALDPDAPRRQKKNLHALDQQDDDNLCKRIFKEIRCGRFEEAVTLCVDSGQMWRGIILQGQRLLDYPDSPQSDSKYPLVGNQSRELWKWCCMQYLKNSEENPHFKATLGILSGNLPSVLPLCHENWDDLLWAHLRVQIEYRVDQYLNEHLSATAVRSDDVIMEVLDKLDDTYELSMHQIFSNVKALYKNKTETRYQEVQRHLILDEIDSLLLKAATWIDDAEYNLLRFLAHLIIILRQIGKDSMRDISDKILKVYIQKLIENTDGLLVSPELVAYYAATLPPKQQIQLFSELMWLVESKEDRLRVIEAGTNAGLDVKASAVETVRYAIKLLKENPVETSKEMSYDCELNEKNLKLVSRITSSLEWLSFYETQITDAVSMSNCIIRTLIFKGDVDSATAVLSRLLHFYPTSVIAENLLNMSNTLREHLCLKAYLEAINGYASWYRQHIGGRPKSPEPLTQEYSFTDKVHYDQIKAQIKLQQEQWAVTSFHQALHTKELLYNVLLFPQGWLIDDTINENLAESAEEYKDRDKQLVSLRKLCVPEIVLLLLKVLQSGNVEGHVEAIGLAEILAAENRKLYSLFSKHKLREVLHKIGESSLCVLENNTDPWGFSTTH